MAEFQQIVLSIVCVTSNDEERFASTINSIRGFKGNIEFVFVCPSDDFGAINQVESLQAMSSFQTKTVHDLGQGIYPAMNIGVKHSAGKFIVFWNSGDCLISNNHLNELVDYLSTLNESWGVFQGFFCWRKEQELTIDNVESFVLQKGGYVSHQTVFVRREIFEKLQNFDESYLVAADAKFITQLYFKIGNPVFFLRPVVSVEFPSYSAIHHRRGRYENFKIALFTIPWNFKIQYVSRLLLINLIYLRNKI